MTELTDERIAEMESRCNAATDGPWELRAASASNRMPARVTALQMVRGYKRERLEPGVVCEVNDYHGRFDEQLDADANFIAHSRQDMPDLIAEVRRLRSLLWDSVDLIDDAIAEAVCEEIGVERIDMGNVDPEKIFTAAIHAART